MNNFELVVDTNNIFGKPKGDHASLLAGDPSIWTKVNNQAKCIPDEVKELLDAIELCDVNDVRDAVSDILVYTYGVAHLAGFNPDIDMKAVYESNLSKLCPNQEILDASLKKYADLGIKVEAQGEFPRVSVISSEFQVVNGEEYPKGKFLKGTLYKKPVLPEQNRILNEGDIVTIGPLEIDDSGVGLYPSEMKDFPGLKGTVSSINGPKDKHPGLVHVFVDDGDSVEQWCFHRKNLI